MGFNKRDFQNEDSNDNWNVAKGYTNDITLEHIRDLRKFERISRFGVFDFENQYEISNEMKIDARIKGLFWYADELSSLIADNIFAIKPSEKSDKDTLKDYMDSIIILKEAIQYAKKEINQRDRITIVIDDLVFGKILDFLIGIKIETLEILNKSDLIFKGIDEFDPDQIKEELFKELTSKG